MQSLLRQCRENFGGAPRSFSFWDRWTYLRVPKPFWMVLGDSTDKLQNYFWSYDSLLRDGFVAWGHIIQANNQLYQPGRQDHPAEMVYCPDPQSTAGPDDLDDVARRLYELKGGEFDDHQTHQIATYLANERVRVFGLEVPEELSGDLDCAISTIYVARKHLPGGRLMQPWMPIVVSVRAPRIVTVLPGRFWPDELVDQWMAAEAQF